MDGGAVRRTGEGALLHGWTSFEGVDAVCDPVAVCVAVGIAENQVGDEPGHDTSVSRVAAERESPSCAAGMGCTALAQCDFPIRARGCETDSGSGALRFELAFRDGDGMLLCRDRFRFATGAESGEVDEDLLANAGANASGDDSDLIHAGAGLRDAVLGAGRGAGFGIHADGMDVSIFRNFSGMAGSGADRQ